MKEYLIKKYEGKIRKTLYLFCTYVFLYSFLGSYLVKERNVEILSIPIYIPIIIAVSIPLTNIIRGVFKSLMTENEWDKKKQLDEYKIFLHILKTVALVIFYFYLQIGITIVFFPTFSGRMINNVPLFIPFFLSNCYLVYLFYNKYIFEK